jgi:DNA-binding response OmpR family regulator
MSTFGLGKDYATVSALKLAVAHRGPGGSFKWMSDLTALVEELTIASVDLVCFSAESNREDMLKACSLIRHVTDAPLLVVANYSAAGPLCEALCLDAGADDYMDSGTSLLAMASRISALVRRFRRMSREERPRVEAGLVIESDQNLYLDGRRVALTPKERRLLDLLANDRGDTVLRAELETALYATSADPRANVKRLIAGLRLKLDHTGVPGSAIRSVYGSGYQLHGVTRSARTQEDTPVPADGGGQKAEWGAR